MKNCPCKDCQKRHFNCHSMYRDYKYWKKEHAEMVAKMKEDSFSFSDANKRRYWRHIMHTRNRKNG